MKSVDPLASLPRLPVTPPATSRPAAAGNPLGMTASGSGAQAAQNGRIHSTAKQFEAVFMTEMLRLARPTSKAAGPFAQGHAEKSWQVFMDQALGQAAVAKDGTGLVPQIEKVLRDAQATSSVRDAQAKISKGPIE